MVGIITVVTSEKYNLELFYFSLINQSYKKFRLYFVDNNSTDGSAEFFEKLNSENNIPVSFIRLNYNSGFSGGSNAGAKEAIKDGCRFLFFLNNDVELDERCVEELVTLFETDKETVCAAPLLFLHRKNQPDVIQEFGGNINFKKGTHRKYFTGKKFSEVSLPETIETDFVGGGICFIRSDVFLKNGMFEESYFAYFDEIDLSYRLKFLNSYQLKVSSKAKAYHNHSAKSKSAFSYFFEYYLAERNKFLFFRKYKLTLAAAIELFSDLLKFPVRLIWFMKVCNAKVGYYYLRGIADGIRGVKGKPYFVK